MVDRGGGGEEKGGVATSVLPNPTAIEEGKAMGNKMKKEKTVKLS